MTSDLAQRIDRVLVLVLGALFVTGATWCLLALATGAWPRFASLPVYVATIGVAYVIGGVVLGLGWVRGAIDSRLAIVVVALTHLHGGRIRTTAGGGTRGPSSLPRVRQRQEG